MESGAGLGRPHLQVLADESQRVEVAVDEQVARVELRLDGEVVQSFSGPPWLAGIDFGGELAPHPLETSDVGWFGPDSLPEATAGAQWWGPMAFAAINGVGSTKLHTFAEPFLGEIRRHLREHGAERGELVGLLLERSEAAIIAILAVLKSGADFYRKASRQSDNGDLSQLYLQHAELRENVAWVQVGSGHGDRRWVPGP